MRGKISCFVALCILLFSFSTCHATPATPLTAQLNGVDYSSTSAPFVVDQKSGKYIRIEIMPYDQSRTYAVYKKGASLPVLTGEVEPGVYLCNFIHDPVIGDAYTIKVEYASFIDPLDQLETLFSPYTTMGKNQANQPRAKNDYYLPAA